MNRFIANMRPVFMPNLGTPLISQVESGMMPKYSSINSAYASLRIKTVRSPPQSDPDPQEHLFRLKSLAILQGFQAS
jgi:hypothetical protein